MIRSSALGVRWNARMIALFSLCLIVAIFVPSYATLSTNSDFSVLSPKANSTVSSQGVVISWSKVAQAVRYKVQLSSTDDPYFEGPDYTFRTSNLQITKSLYPMDYIVRVSALNDSGKKIARTKTITFIASKNGVITTTTTQPVSSSTTTASTTTTTVPKVVTTSTVPTTNPPPTSTSGLWRPGPGTSWYWQINGTVNENVNVTMYDIDLFDAVPSARSYAVSGFGAVNVPKGDNAGVVDRLHAKGKVVICYVDTGAAERNRPDFNLFPTSVQGTVAEASDGTQWDEKWLDTRQESWSKWAPLMWARFDLAKSIGCDGVEPDQNNHLGNNTGFPESVSIDQAWFLEVAKQAHARGLSVGMKNGVESINTQLVGAFDWALNEECNQYDECNLMTPFIEAGKAVFNAEYPNVKGGASQSKTCATASKLKLSSMGYPLELGGGYYFDCLTGTSLSVGNVKK